MGLKERSLGTVIRSLRKQNDMTQAALAQKLGITDKAVSKWERDISYPDITLFPKLADLLGVSIDDLLKECGGEAGPSRLEQIFRMSHDIRTPLNIILGYTDLAAKYRDDPEQLMRCLENIRVSGEYLLAVIDRLMDVAYRGGAGGGPDGAAPPGDGLWEALRQAPPAAEPPVRYDFSGKRILLAEDMALNREIALELLRQTGAETDIAENGEICVEKIRRGDGGGYDLILMDIQMPGMNGLEATRAIRGLADREKASIPIIAMTASVYEKDRAAAFAAGMNDFCEKPIAAEKLFAAMKRFL